MAEWLRIDQTHRLRNPEPEPGQRVYGLGGKLWPRLALSVQRDTSMRVSLGPTFSISCSTKVAGGAWWSKEHPIPCTLRGEVRQMLDELEASDE